MKFKKLLTVVLAAAVAVSASAQTRTISGKVLDSKGEALIGASLQVKGTSDGFITDIDGNYELKGVKLPATIIVSFIGYKDTEIEMTGNEAVPFNIVLSDDATILDDVVVVGYASMKKRDLVGAVDAVGSEVIGNRPNSNLARSLQGEVAGLNITISDSKPSHAGSYNVRGEGSIGAGGSSLVLIDGVEGDLNMVNPQDVESVSVLKDASSTAVYGARGAFGVILVTTKNAKQGRPVVNYNGSLSINRRTVIPDGIWDSNEWLDWWIECYNGSTKSAAGHILSEGDHGYILVSTKYVSEYSWPEKKYLRPIPNVSVTMNEKLGQNAGW